MFKLHSYMCEHFNKFFWKSLPKTHNDKNKKLSKNVNKPKCHYQLASIVVRTHIK